jgi:hypothetical protein
VLDGNIGFHANENSQVSFGDFPVDTVKAGKIEVADQKIKLFGIRDAGPQQFREKFSLVGDESGHCFTPLAISERLTKLLPTLC